MNLARNDRSSRALLGALALTGALLLSACSSPEQRAQSYYEHGMQYLAQKDYVKAGVELRNALQLKKDMVSAWRGLAEIELHNNNVQGAVPILRNIVELDPKDIKARLQLGHFLLAGNALDQALELANAAVALDDHNPNTLAFKAAVLLKVKNAAEAKRDAEAALQIEPGNAEALIVLAAERSGSGDTEGALSILDRAGSAQSEGDDLAIQVFKLSLFEKSKDWDKAEALLRKLSERYPQESAFRRNLVRLLIEQKRFDDAEKELRALADANPSDIEAGLNVVRFLQQFKGADAARQELLTRIKAGGQTFKYQIALADFDLARGNVADSVKLLEHLASSAASAEDTLTAQIRLAQIQFQQKKFDAADTLVAAILRKDSRNIDGLKLRAAIRLERGQVDAAIADLRQALDDQPRSSDIMVLMGAAYERGGSIELADKEFAEATRISNFNPAVGLAYATFLRRRGGLARAEDVLTELARRSPTNVAVLSNLAEVRLALQNWAGAEQVADAIRRLGGTQSQSVSDQIQAAALSGEGKYSDSIKILESVQATTPTAALPMASLVNTFIRAQKLDQAVNFLQTVLKANPANADARVLLGSVLLLKNAPDQAVQNFKAAIEQQPKEPGGYVALANYYAREKKIDEAEKVVRAGLAQQADSFALQMASASIMELRGDFDGAIATYEKLLQQQPDSMIVANNLASLLSDHHPDKASLERANSLAAVLRKSEIPSFKDTLGWLDYLRGDYKSATGLLEAAAAALPNRAVVQYHLGMVYAATGQAVKAAEQFKKALALGPDSVLQEKINTAQKKAAL